jgi:hypothetical protein
MKNVLLILITFCAITGCSKKDSYVLNSGNDLDNQKELLKAIGFDLNKITIHEKAKVNPDSALVFHSIEEAKNYFKDLIRPRNANYLDTLKMLSKSRGDFDAYFKSLIERNRNLKQKNGNRSAMSTTDVDYYSTDQDVDDESILWNNMELSTPYNDYDPIVNQDRFFSDLQNGALADRHGVANMYKLYGLVGYNLKFNWSFAPGGPLVSNVKSSIVGVSLFMSLDSWDGGDFRNYPGSSLIYYYAYANLNYNIVVESIGTFSTIPITFFGVYNTNDKKYTMTIQGDY